MSEVDPITQMELEIDKRRKDNDAWVLKRLREIMKKPKELMDKADKGFLRSRRSYLTLPEVKAFEDVLEEDLSPKVKGPKN